jgi:hypothetical protein
LEGELAGHLAIKDGTKGIADSAFSNWQKGDWGKSLTQVTIPQSVRTIGRNAFWLCENLKSVAIQSSIVSIGQSAFNHCGNLTDVTIQPGVISIGDGAFYACSNLTSVVIPEGVTSIEPATFAECHRLTSITLPASVTNIGDAAFAYTSLTSVTIPASVTHTGRSVFDSSLLREAVFLGKAPRADEVYRGASEKLTTYVMPGSTGWDGNPDSETLPALWEKRTIMHVSSIPLVTAKAPVAAGAAEVNEFHAWLDKLFPDNKGDYEALANKRGANGIPVWDSYVAGLDPTDHKSRFTAFITMEEGSPIITWEPRLRSRVYTVVGKESLSDTADWGKTNSLTRFFKVRVELQK